MFLVEWHITTVTGSPRPYWLKHLGAGITATCWPWPPTRCTGILRSRKIQVQDEQNEYAQVHRNKQPGYLHTELRLKCTLILLDMLFFITSYIFLEKHKRKLILSCFSFSFNNSWLFDAHHSKASDAISLGNLCLGEQINKRQCMANYVYSKIDKDLQNPLKKYFVWSCLLLELIVIHLSPNQSIC